MGSIALTFQFNVSFHFDQPPVHMKQFGLLLLILTSPLIELVLSEQ